MPPPRKRIMREFRIDEISGVDNPAQEGARVAVMKRDDGEAQSPLRPAQKGIGDLADLLTGEEAGHQHGIAVSRYDNQVAFSVSYGFGPDEERGHDHPIARAADGQYVLGVVAGHPHTIDQDAMGRAVLALVTKNTAGATGTGGEMPDEQKDEQQTDASAGAEPTVEALQKRLDRANAVIALGSDERAHYDALSDEAAQEAFLVKSADGRRVEIAATQDADPVVYTTADGVAIRKSAGDAFIALAKSNDALRKEADALRAEREQEALEKRADVELSHLPGDVKVRAAMLQALEDIPEAAQREAAHNMLKAQNAVMATAFETRGVGIGPAEGSPDDALAKLAQAYAKEHGVTEAAAYAAVMDTPEGAAVYAKSISGGK